MKVEIRHSPSFAVARCFLGVGEQINVESNAMYACSSGIEVESRMEGGFLAAAKRSLLAHDSFFMSKFTSHNPDGWVDVVPNLPGDIFALNIDTSTSAPLVVTKGAWIASDLGVQLDANLGTIATVFNGEGLFITKASGRGTIVAAAYGAIDQHSLKAGESVTIDTGHLVAYEYGIDVRLRKVSTGILNTLKSGEGLVMDFTGPGDIITQSRNPAAFGAWISSMVPQSNANVAGGFASGLGSLLSN